MRETENQKMAMLSEKIWEILISRQLMTTLEYPPSSLNKVADLENCRKGPIWMGPLSTCLLQSLPGFICFKGVTKSSTICYMKTRSLQHSHGPNVNSLDTGSLLRISPILSDSPFAKQNTTRLSTHSNVDNTLLANTVVVSTGVGNTNKEKNSST